MNDDRLRIGILGAARIAAEAIVAPAQSLGHDLVAIASRDLERAESFAAEHGVDRAYGNYADLLASPDVDVVYNALVNSEHTMWNLAALRAGKHVLSEKPLGSNADEVSELQATAATSPGWIYEGFHYIHHPVNQRLKALVGSGDLGEIRSVDIELAYPSPPDNDPRWSLELSGGATMDLGCYVLDAARRTGAWVGHRPEVVNVDVVTKSPGVDAAMRVDITYGGAISGSCRWDMAAPHPSISWTVTGTEGSVTSPYFAVPHVDNRLLTVVAGTQREEVVGSATSYTYQLSHFAEVVHRGAPYPKDLESSLETAALIDECYRRAGLPLRGRPLHLPQ